MNQLTLAYVNQADRERDVQDGLRARQLLNPASQTRAPHEPSPSAPIGARQAPIRARAAGR